MAVNLSALAGAGQQFFDNNGVILSGGKLYSYAAGTTTHQTTYTSATGSTAHTNPIILDSAGRVATGEIWLTAGSNYKFVLYTSTNVLLATWDNITGINGTGITSNAVNVQYDPPFAGAVPLSVEDKLAQFVNVADFGAVGNGVTDDTQAIQAAINAIQSVGGGQVFFEEGLYRITSTLTANVGVLLNGQSRTDVSSNTNGSSVTAARPTILWDGPAVIGAYMYVIKPAIVGNCVWGGGAINLEWNGNDKAEVGVHFDNTKYSTFDGKVRQVTFAGVLVNSASGVPGNFSMKNQIRSLEFIWGTTIAVQNADGLSLGGNASNVPSTQQLVGDVSGLVYNGSLVRIAETDNAQFQSVHGVVQTGGTGASVTLINTGAQPSNHNVFYYCVGLVKFDNGLIGNNFIAYNSEGGGFSQLAGTSDWVGNLIDYVTGQQYTSHNWKLRDKISLASSQLRGSSGTTLEEFALQWPCVSLPAATNNKVSAIIPTPYWLDDGEIYEVEFILGKNGTGSGDYVLEINLSTGTTASPAVTPERTQLRIVTAGAQYTPTTYTFDFLGSPLPFTKGDHIFLSAWRKGLEGSDTDPDSAMVLGVRIMFKGQGPNSSGSGTYYIPTWS